MGELKLRISDLDDDLAAAVLPKAVADGRLVLTEYSLLGHVRVAIG